MKARISGHGAAVTGKKQHILAGLLRQFRESCEPLDVERFRIEHEQERHLIDELESDGFLVQTCSGYVPTVKGLLACNNLEAREELTGMRRLLPILQDAYRENPKECWTPDALASRSGQDAQALRRGLILLVLLEILPRPVWDWRRGMPDSVRLTEQVLDITFRASPDHRRGASRMKAKISGHDYVYCHHSMSENAQRLGAFVVEQGISTEEVLELTFGMLADATFAWRDTPVTETASRCEAALMLLEQALFEFKVELHGIEEKCKLPETDEEWKDYLSNHLEREVEKLNSKEK